MSAIQEGDYVCLFMKTKENIFDRYHDFHRGFLRPTECGYGRTHRIVKCFVSGFYKQTEFIKVHELNAIGREVDRPGYIDRSLVKR